MARDKDYVSFKKNLTIGFSWALQMRKGMAGFIVGLCCIDWMATYYFGRDTNSNDYKEFVKRFLPQYNPEELYHDLRCGLVHNFTDRGKVIKYDFREDRSKHHLRLRPRKGNRGVKMRVINLSNFIHDLRFALNKFFDVLEHNPEMMRRSVQRYKKVGLVDGSVESL